MPTNPKVTEEMVREMREAIASSDAIGGDAHNGLLGCKDASRWIEALLDERQHGVTPFDERLTIAMKNAPTRRDAIEQARREGWEACREAAANLCEKIILDDVAEARANGEDMSYSGGNEFSKAIRNLEYPEG